jgi:hypothetical protein
VKEARQGKKAKEKPTTLGGWGSRVAPLEAVIGQFIEISFIATFTQRFFGAK